MLWLGRRRSTRLPCIVGCFRGKDVLFEKALADKFFQVLLDVSAEDGLVPFKIMVKIIFFCSGECGVILDWPRVLVVAF